LEASFSSVGLSRILNVKGLDADARSNFNDAFEPRLK